MDTPPSKRYCLDHSLDHSLEDQDSECGSNVSLNGPDNADLIFPSDDECDSYCTELEENCFFYPSEESSQVVCNDNDNRLSGGLVFYPSEESNQLSAAKKDAPYDNCSIKDLDFETSSEDETVVNCDEELEKIGKLLIGICCDKLCLRHCTAIDIISTRIDFLKLSKTERKQYLFTKIREIAAKFEVKPTLKVVKLR